MFNTLDKAKIYSPYNDGLIGWYLTLPGLDGGKIWYDLMNYNHLTLTSNVVFSNARPRSGAFGSVSMTSGTGATSSGTYKLPTGNGPRTMSGWFYPVTGPNMGLINLTGVTSFSMYYFFDGVNYHYFTDGQNANNNLSTTTAADNLTLGVWQHMTISCTSSNVSIYKNGRRVINQAWGTTINTSTTGLTIGYRGNAFDGYIDDVRLWNRKISDQEAMGLYLDSLTGYRESLPALEHMFSISSGGGPVGSAFMTLFGSGGL